MKHYYLQRLHPVVNDFRLKSTSPTTMFHGHNSPPLFNLHNPFFGKMHPRNIIGLQFPNLVFNIIVLHL